MRRDNAIILLFFIALLCIDVVILLLAVKFYCGLQLRKDLKPYGGIASFKKRKILSFFSHSSLAGKYRTA